MYRDRKTVVPLVGAPNSGKSTLFNWLTGAKQKTVNYPGSTVEFLRGPASKNYNKDIAFIDTPGIYSLFPKSRDEEVTHKILFDEQHSKQIVFVMDATQIQRHLYILKQLKEAGFEITIALTMVDILKKAKQNINFVLLESELNCKVVCIDGRLGGGVKELIEHLEEKELDKKIKPLKPWSEDKQDSVHNDIRELVEKITLYRDKQAPNKTFLHFTYHLDRIFLNSFWGSICFLAIMFFLFASIFWFATPFMDIVDGFFGDIATLVQTNLKPGLFNDFLSNGIIGSIGAFMVFAPQIFILFLIIGVLEDSGYLARAASLSDRLLSKAGLNGKAFVPILSGFACAVPAMMATRNMENKKERMLTLLILPIMTCSARLPVFALFISFILWDKMFLAGAALASVYFISLMFGLLIAAVGKKFIKGSDKVSNFILELPIYRMPMWKNIIRSSYQKMMSYIKKAGPIIFALSVLIWLLSTFPNYNEEDRLQRFETSYMAKIGQTIEPVFKPMGADWRIGTALLSAFAAREVFVGTLATLFKITEEDEDAQANTLLDKMANAKNDVGEPLFTWPVIISLFVYFILALQCIATTAIARKESGSTKFAIGQTVGLNALAYIMAVITYQVLILF